MRMPRRRWPGRAARPRPARRPCTQRRQQSSGPPCAGHTRPPAFAGAEGRTSAARSGADAAPPSVACAPASPAQPAAGRRPRGPAASGAGARRSGRLERHRPARKVRPRPHGPAGCVQFHDPRVGPPLARCLGQGLVAGRHRQRHHVIPLDEPRPPPRGCPSPLPARPPRPCPPELRGSPTACSQCTALRRLPHPPATPPLATSVILGPR